MARTEVSTKSQKKVNPAIKSGSKKKANSVVEINLSKAASKKKVETKQAKPKSKTKQVVAPKKTKSAKVETRKLEKAKSLKSAKVEQVKVSTKSVKKAPEKKVTIANKKIVKTRVVTTKAKTEVVVAGKTKFGKDVTKRERPQARTAATRASNAANPQVQALLAPTEEMLKPFREAAKRNQANQKAKQKEVKQKNFLAKPQKTGKKVTVDLRLHSPMSEGYFSTGGVDPAGAMVRLAKAKGLDMIAVTDYHSAEFVDIITEKAKDTTVSVLPGVDLRCRINACNEVYFVALFEEGKSSDDLYRVLAKIGVPLSARGSKDYVVGKSLKEIIEVVEEEGGILIPSRIDKTPNRLNTAKTLVEEFGFHAFDMVHPENPDYFKDRWPGGEFTFFSFSNANSLGQIGSRTFSTKMSSEGFKGLKELVGRRRAE
jgi:hypothetical protein